MLPGADQPGGEATNLFDALDKAMADIPPSRMAGAIFITDGHIHDAPARRRRGSASTRRCMR